MSFHVVDLSWDPAGHSLTTFNLRSIPVGGNGAGGGIRPLSHFPHGGAAGRERLLLPAGCGFTRRWNGNLRTSPKDVSRRREKRARQKTGDPVLYRVSRF